MEGKRTSTITRHEVELGEVTRGLLKDLFNPGLKLDALLTAINNLDRKVDKFMSTQEQRLRGVQEALNAIAEGINKLQQQILDLKTNNPELEDEIGSIETTVKAIADDITGVVPPDPAPEG